MSNPNTDDPNLQNDTDLLRDIAPDWQSAPVGATVTARDGQTIGTVSNKSDDGLYVQSAGSDADSPDYFVTSADIASVDPDGVKLLVAASEVMRARPESEAQDTLPSATDDAMEP